MELTRSSCVARDLSHNRMPFPFVGKRIDPDCFLCQVREAYVYQSTMTEPQMRDAMDVPTSRVTDKLYDWMDAWTDTRNLSFNEITNFTEDMFKVTTLKKLCVHACHERRVPVDGCALAHARMLRLDVR